MPYLLLEYGLPLSMHYGRQPATVSHMGISSWLLVEKLQRALRASAYA
jgi:hypothetical protein